MTQIVSFHVSDEMADDIVLLARLEDATTGEVMRDALRRDIKRRTLAYSTKATKRPDIAPPQALAG